MSSNYKPLGILGGTFDPVHNGHLRLALEVMAALDLAGVRLLPAAVPPHREQPAASAEQRLRMLQLAIEDIDGLGIDARELERTGPSYTVDTLAGLRMELKDQPLCLIMGRDAFRNIDTWYQWKNLLDYAHIIIADRPGAGPDLERREVAEFLTRHLSTDPGKLRRDRAGSIASLPIPALDISASRIRELAAVDRDLNGLVPAAVRAYIRRHSLYR